MKDNDGIDGGTPGSVSEDDALRLSAFIDGELEAEEGRSLVERVGLPQVQDSEHRAELLRSGLRDYIEAERLDAPALFVWDKIAPELDKNNPIADLLAEIGARVSVGARVLIRPPALAAAAAAAAVVLVVGSKPVEEPAETLPDQIALLEHNSQPAESSAPTQQGVVPEVTFVGLGAGQSRSSSGLFSSLPLERFESRYGGERSGAEVAALAGARAPRRPVLTYRSLARRAGAMHSLSGGLRVGGADIEWIKSMSSVEIVPSASRRKPPVIWVGNKVR